jgi:hypothetical protein
MNSPKVTRSADPATVKACCAAAYEQDLVALLLHTTAAAAAVTDGVAGYHLLIARKPQGPDVRQEIRRPLGM